MRGLWFCVALQTIVFAAAIYAAGLSFEEEKFPKLERLAGYIREMRGETWLGFTLKHYYSVMFRSTWGGGSDATILFFFCVLSMPMVIFFKDLATHNAKLSFWGAAGVFVLSAIIGALIAAAAGSVIRKRRENPFDLFERRAKVADELLKKVKGFRNEEREKVLDGTSYERFRGMSFEERSRRIDKEAELNESPDQYNYDNAVCWMMEVCDEYISGNAVLRKIVCVAVAVVDLIVILL